MSRWTNGPESRTWKSAWRATMRSTRSSSKNCGGNDLQRRPHRRDRARPLSGQQPDPRPPHAGLPACGDERVDSRRGRPAHSSARGRQRERGALRRPAWTRHVHRRGRDRRRAGRVARVRAARGRADGDCRGAGNHRARRRRDDRQTLRGRGLGYLRGRRRPPPRRPHRRRPCRPPKGDRGTARCVGAPLQRRVLGSARRKCGRGVRASPPRPRAERGGGAAVHGGRHRSGLAPRRPALAGAQRMNIVHIDELETIPVGDRGLQWRPIRSRFGIRAFGTNAYTADVGDEIVEEHTEQTYGHEEMYVVVSGRATFILDGEEVDAPAGTIVHLPDPAVRRKAVAKEPETTVLAVGAKPGEAFQPSGWELGFRGAQMEPAEAVAYVEAPGKALSMRSSAPSRWTPTAFANGERTTRISTRSATIPASPPRPSRLLTF